MRGAWVETGVLRPNHRMPVRALRQNVVRYLKSLIQIRPNHRMPVRALRHVRGVHFHVSFLERSESSNARQGIKTGQMIRRVHIEQNRPNHRMPVRALRRVNDIILVVSILLSESSNARQGIKTEPPRSYP